MQTLMVKNGSRYRKATPAEIAVVAGAHALEALNRSRPHFRMPAEYVEHLQRVFAGRDYESFVVFFLDSHHRLMDAVELFRGSIDISHVHKREVVKECLWRGSAAVILAHNHPSGVNDASVADEAITRQLLQALALVEVRLLDHIIIAGPGGWYSMAEHGLL
jgi:DNA repair protein RadC